MNSFDAKPLSAKERSVLIEVQRGMQNRAIGEKLNITENTVRMYLKSCYRKLGVRNRVEAAVAAYGMGVRGE